MIQSLLNAADNSAFNPNINHWEYNFQNNISYKLTNTTTVNLRMMAQIGSQKGPNNKTTDIYKKVMPILSLSPLISLAKKIIFIMVMPKLKLGLTEKTLTNT